jgi:outer membrane protein OmpA-like peptidoglycan-associated protein
MLIKSTLALLVFGGACAVPAFSQTSAPNPTQQTTVSREDIPVYRVTVVGRTTPAINYRHRSGATKVDFRGTALLPDARGEAKVESKQGYIEIEVEFDELAAATKYGPEYLTYVMWAITPEGRSTNLGEVLLNGSESKLNVTTELQAFGLIVTAEPYFAVTQPSDVVVMENVVRSDTRGAVEAVEAKYELLQRGTYLMSSDASRLPSRRPGKLPLELAEARNAVYFARIAGADEYAAETFSKATGLLAKAEQDHARDRGSRAVIGMSREAAQAAEDSRLIALQRREAELVARERQRTIEREAAARAGEAEALRRAENEARQRANAEADRARAESARSAAEQARAEAERATQLLARERAELENQARQLAQDRAAANARAEQFGRERAEADARSEQLARERAAADARAQQATDAVAKAERERAELREKLQQQLSVILETRESARGLIVNMSDVLFDTASATLKPGAREKLARVAGILLSYPELKIEIEGHTDSVGSEEYNQDLSERRAASVRAYLVGQGISQQTVDAHGFGEDRPVATNNTGSGRQQNRRVELVISGESIAAPTERR